MQESQVSRNPSSNTGSSTGQDKKQREFKLCPQMTGFSEHMGPFFERDTIQGMERGLKVEAHHLNPEGVVHGGVVLSFMDYVIYRAIGDSIGHQIKFATINLNSNFIAAAKQGDFILGSGKVVRKTKSVIFAEGLLWTDQRQIMTASGIWKIIHSN